MVLLMALGSYIAGYKYSRNLPLKSQAQEFSSLGRNFFGKCNDYDTNGEIYCIDEEIRVPCGKNAVQDLGRITYCVQYIDGRYRISKQFKILYVLNDDLLKLSSLKMKFAKSVSCMEEFYAQYD